eukprot:1038201-Prymnesium_polylepis.1
MRTASRSATRLRFRSPVRHSLTPAAATSTSFAPSINTARTPALPHSLILARADLSCSALIDTCISPSAVTCTHITHPAALIRT